MNKLEKLMEIEGFEDSLEFMGAYITDSVSPGICKNPGCDYTIEVELDQTKGWCEDCNTQSVVSGMILAGVI